MIFSPYDLYNASVTGGSGGGTPSFVLPLNDLGAGAVNTTPIFGSGSVTPTFTRATTAWTKLSTGLWASVASGTARSLYLGANTAVGAYGGYLAEGARTNLALQARDLSNASWTKVNTTGAKDQIGIDGVTNSASSLTSTLGGGTCLQTITEAATLSALSIFIKRITGTGTVTLQQGSSTLEISASLNSLTYTRVEVDATVLNPIIGIVLGTNGDKIAVDIVQFENGSFASSPIPTTTVSVARNADVLTYPRAGNANNATGSAYVEVYLNDISAANGHTFIGANGINRFLMSEGNTAISSFDGANNPIYTGLTASVGAIQKWALSWGSSLSSAYKGGTASSANPTTFNNNFGLTDISIGSNNSGSNPLFGTIRNVRIYPTALSAAQLQAMTT